MKRPIFVFLLGYLVGIIIGLYCKISIAFLVCIVLILIELIIRYFKKSNIVKYISIILNRKILITFSIAIVISNTVVVVLNNSYNNKYKNIKTGNFKATVVSRKTEKDYYTQYKVKIETINDKADYKNTYLLLKIKDNVDLQYGEKILFFGEYIQPETKRNFKGFDYKEYLKSISIYGTVNADNVKIIGKSEINIFANISEKVAIKMKQRIESNIEEDDNKNILLSILLGYKENLDPDIEESFRDSNLSHILVISGMHVSYLIMAVSGLLYILKVPKRISKIVTIIFLIFFIYLTGETVSVKRACIMGILSLLASILYRKSDIINNISIALLIILINNPFAITNSSLILSFASIIGIILLYPILYEEKSKNSNILIKMKQTIITSISVQLFIFPITILLYNKISLIFILSNLIVSVLIENIIILGYIFIIVPIKPVILILNKLIEILIFVSNFFSKLPFSNITIVTPNLIFVILYYTCMFSIIYIYQIRKKKPKRRIEKILLYRLQEIKAIIIKNKGKIILVIVIIITFYNIISNTNCKLIIRFIDVGQGDSTLIITPSKKIILIDGGGSETYDVGKNTLLPYLLDRRITKIDFLIISHFDTDHVRTDYLL